LGDRFDRRQLIVTLSIFNALTLAFAALSSSFIELAIASFMNGITAVVPQLIVPFAAQLAAPEQRGRVVGKVMSGLLSGIVLARLGGGLMGAMFGWRSVFWGAAGVMLVLAIVLANQLPTRQASTQLPYCSLLRSLPHLLITQPLLRECSLTGAMLFGAYSSFWATLSFLLEQPPLEYGSQVAGLFGLTGIVGAAIAPIVGRFADRSSPRLTMRCAIATITIAFLILFGLRSSLIGLAIGAILLDLGTQTGQISNQARIYTLPAEALNRITTIYMVSYFIGGSLGSLLSTSSWNLIGWSGVCWVGFSAMAIAIISLKNVDG
jgi:predicted MFS family arabinose efflux permease